MLMICCRSVIVFRSVLWLAFFIDSHDCESPAVRAPAISSPFIRQRLIRVLKLFVKQKIPRRFRNCPRPLHGLTAPENSHLRSVTPTILLGSLKSPWPPNANCCRRQENRLFSAKIHAIEVSNLLTIFSQHLEWNGTTFKLSTPDFRILFRINAVLRFELNHRMTFWQSICHHMNYKGMEGC